ncbi:MAG: hypothetical protein ABIO70_23320 [Pseudomonadota bacterium]
MTPRPIRRRGQATLEFAISSLTIITLLIGVVLVTRLGVVCLVVEAMSGALIAGGEDAVEVVHDALGLSRQGGLGLSVALEPCQIPAAQVGEPALDAQIQGRRVAALMIEPAGAFGRQLPSVELSGTGGPCLARGAAHRDEVSLPEGGLGPGQDLDRAWRALAPVVGR